VRVQAAGQRKHALSWGLLLEKTHTSPERERWDSPPRELHEQRLGRALDLVAGQPADPQGRVLGGTPRPWGIATGER
jgi:hypothetical protein